MSKQYFFDDQRLFVRENLERVYGGSQLVGTYRDPNVIIGYGWAWGIKGPDGRTHLLYEGYETGTNHVITAAAISDDGVHFVPRNTAVEAGIENPRLPNQLLPCAQNHSEMATVIEDPYAPAEERYKILYTDNAQTHTDWVIVDYILTSPDLIHWKKMIGSCWNPQGTEPLTGVFYNKVSGGYTILSRPDWGQRRVGITETRDWHYYTPLEMCLQCDSLDAPLTEIYGMPAMAYDDIFIGFPHIYSNLPQALCTKFSSGTMHVELAYSLNGHHWQRSLRTPFLSGEHPQLVERDGAADKMLFVLSAVRQADRSLLLYATTNKHEHGFPVANYADGDTSVSIFALRADGFVGLKAKQAGRLATREIAWLGGDLRVNLEAEKATCAIYVEGGRGAQPVPGLGHEDCRPFSGDCAEWKPMWQSGVSLDSMKEKTIIVEIRLENGIIYSLDYDGKSVMNIEAVRYRQRRQLPRRLGFQA